MAVQNIEITAPIQAPPPAVFLTELAFGMKMTQALCVVANRIIPTQIFLSIIESR